MTDINLIFRKFLGLTKMNEVLGFVEVPNGHPVLRALERGNGSNGHEVVNPAHLDFVGNSSLLTVLGNAVFEHPSLGQYIDSIGGMKAPFSTHTEREKIALYKDFCLWLESAQTVDCLTGSR